MNVEKNDQATTKPCVMCKTFFGSQSSDWMCSVCYKKKNGTEIKTQVKKPEQKPIQVMKKQEQKEMPVIKQADKARCYKCNKKVGLLGVACKCEFVFCNLHRIPQQHECTINYRAIGQQKLTKQIQKVAPKKITQI